MGPLGNEFYPGEKIVFEKLTVFEGSSYSDPEFSWQLSPGVTAIRFLESEKYGNSFTNDMIVGDVYGHLYHLELNEDRTGFVFLDSDLYDLVANEQEETESLIFGRNFGLITDIKIGPDGYLYVVSMVTSEEGIPFLEWAFHTDDPTVETQGPGSGTIYRILPIQQELLEQNSNIIKITDTDYYLKFQIYGGSVDEIKPNFNSNSLIIMINSTKGEPHFLTLTLPGSILVSKISGMYNDFIVTVDNKMSEFSELKTPEGRKLTISFTENTEKIEIRGTQRNLRNSRI